MQQIFGLPWEQDGKFKFQMSLNDNQILILLTSIGLLLDITLMGSTIYNFFLRKTKFAAAHCLSPMIAFFWMTSILVYMIYYQDSMTSMLDLLIFMPFWTTIFYIIMVIFHWKLHLLRSVISKKPDTLVVILKISFAISTATFLGQIILYILFLITPNREKSLSFANPVSGLVMIYVFQQLLGLILVVSSIRKIKNSHSSELQDLYRATLYCFFALGVVILSLILRQTITNVSYIYSITYLIMDAQIIFFNKFFVSTVELIACKDPKNITITQDQNIAVKKSNIFFQETRIE